MAQRGLTIMCPVKTENLTRNVPRAEGEFLRALAAKLGVKSRSYLENFLILEGLKAVRKSAARKLAKIRAATSGRTLGSGALLALLLAGWVAAGGHHDPRGGRSVRLAHAKAVKSGTDFDANCAD